MAAKRRKSRRRTTKSRTRRAPARKASRRAAPRRRRRSPSRGAVGRFKGALRRARRSVRRSSGGRGFVAGMKAGVKEAIPLAIITGIITGTRVIGEKAAEKLGLTNRITNEDHLRLVTIGLTGLLLYTVAHFLAPKYSRLVIVATVTLVGAQFLERLISEALSKIEMFGAVGDMPKATKPAEYAPPATSTNPTMSTGQSDAQKAQDWLKFGLDVTSAVGLTGPGNRSHNRIRGMLGSEERTNRVAGLLGRSSDLSRTASML